MVYNTTHKVAQFCNGTHWISMAPGSAPAADPRIGILTNGKWCTSDGATVNCTEDAPDTGLAEAAGDAGEIQFNDGADGLDADVNLHWDNTNKRLGIGTASPATTLHVNGSVTTGNRLLGGFAYGSDYFWMGLTGTAAATNRIGIGFEANDVTGAIKNIHFRTMGSTNLVLDDSGNVGIGTMAPGAKLDVAGTINASGLEIAGEPYARTFAVRSSDATRKCISANYAPTGYSDDECTWIATGSHHYDGATIDTFPTYSDSTCTTVFDAHGLKRIQYSDVQNNSTYFKISVISGYYDTLLCIKGSSTQTLQY
ncbi:hypothetical protein [Hyphomicrobium sp.]|uniref:hypothetical protein n=1 Tax=Hyphomicrobium sp. TaxID=82 RepID=UPI0025B80894|nr:hypothetical protein [Hyphomicrobium sp.]MCC7250458.1 hypothetical protein [Hyphomicrobium sp.]